MSTAINLGATPRGCISPPGLVLRFWGGRGATSLHLKALPAYLPFPPRFYLGPTVQDLHPIHSAQSPSFRSPWRVPCTHPLPRALLAAGDASSHPLMRALRAAGSTCIHPLGGGTCVSQLHSVTLEAAGERDLSLFCVHISAQLPGYRLVPCLHLRQLKGQLVPLPEQSRSSLQPHHIWVSQSLLFPSP